MGWGSRERGTRGDRKRCFLESVSEWAGRIRQNSTLLRHKLDMINIIGECKMFEGNGLRRKSRFGA